MKKLPCLNSGTATAQDPALRNNLGFCLIPVEPRRALEQLKAAANMGYEDGATNAYNQMCCYVAIGRSRAALNVADLESHKQSREAKDVLLWRQTIDGSWGVFESDYPLNLSGFAAEVARIEGWKDQEEHWAAISKQLAESPASTERQEQTSHHHPMINDPFDKAFGMNAQAVRHPGLG